MLTGMTDEAWTMEALLRYRVPATFTPNSTSEGSTSLRCSFIHAIEGHHRIFGAVVLRVIDFLPRKYTLNLGLATDYSRQVS
jgi:hypothetical protein